MSEIIEMWAISKGWERIPQSNNIWRHSTSYQVKETRHWLWYWELEVEFGKYLKKL